MIDYCVELPNDVKVSISVNVESELTEIYMAFARSQHSIPEEDWEPDEDVAFAEIAGNDREEMDDYGTQIYRFQEEEKDILPMSDSYEREMLDRWLEELDAAQAIERSFTKSDPYDKNELESWISDLKAVKRGLC